MVSVSGDAGQGRPVRCGRRSYLLDEEEKEEGEQKHVKRGADRSIRRSHRRGKLDFSMGEVKEKKQRRGGG